MSDMLDLNMRHFIIKEMCVRSFYNFFKYFWNIVESVPFEDNWHIKLVCDTLEERFRYWVLDDFQMDYSDNSDIKYDILLNLPPGSSKSLIVSEFFPCWVWLMRPEVKFITYSYSQRIAEELSGKSLKILTNETYLSMVKFKISSLAVSNIKNSYGGQRFVTSTSATSTGFHADIIIGDDPNSPNAIHSKTDRENTKRFVNEVLPSRKTNVKRSYCITVQQRFHQEDVSSIIIANDKRKLKHIVVPAIDSNGVPFCDRFPLDFLEGQKQTLGTVQFMAQYQQVTMDEQGGIIKKDWLQDINQVSKPLTYFLDTAYGGVNADDNAILGCYKDGNNLVIQFLEVNKMEFPQLINWLKTNIPQNSKMYIEGKASGKSIIQTLKQQTSFNIIETQPKGSKMERKHSVSPFFESGRIFINTSINYRDKLIEQIIYDGGKNDDIMDVVCMGIDKMLKNNSGIYHIK